MKPNKLVFLLAGLLVFAFCALSFPCAGAEDNACSLTLQCTYEDGGSKTALAGDTYSIAKIASARVTGAEGKPLLQYTLLPAYQSFDCDWGALTSMQLREKAMAIYEAVEKSKDYLASQTTDAKGTLVFDKLEAGMYLVVRTRAVNSSYRFEPYLISVPQVTAGQLTYAVVSEPKFSADKPVTPDKPEGGKLPQTGQLIWPIFLLGGLGALLIPIGLIRMRAEKKHERTR